MVASSSPSHRQDSIGTLIIGAGPFGLSLAARLSHHGIDHRILGDAMGFWRHHMPSGMFLRSSWDWYLDPQGYWTIERFFQERKLDKSTVNPIPISTYLDYVEWFQKNSGIEPENILVKRVLQAPEGGFVAELENGERLRARTIVLALGFSSFAHAPAEIESSLPAGYASHTLEAVDFSNAVDKRYLIVGGRQSAFEWAALLAEAGAKHVDIIHRHASPAFAEADWTWVPPLMDEMVANPSWFRSLPAEEQQSHGRRLWGEGRLKVEPWLEPRIVNAPVSIWPEIALISSTPRLEGLEVLLSNGRSIQVDQVILATGYKPDIGKLDLLAGGGLLDQISSENGLPHLDAGFQSSVPGLYVTSLLAGKDFGPFFGFTVASRGAATVLGDDLARLLS